MKADAALAELAALGVADALSQPDESDFPRGAPRLSLPNLGARRLENWSALRDGRLRELLGAFGSPRAAADWAARGRLLRLLGERERAQACFLAAARKGGLRAWLWLGELHLARDPRRALRCLARGREAAPLEPLFALWLGAAELTLARPARCLRALEAAGGSHTARLLRARALIALRRGGPARAELAAAVADDPDSSCAHVLRGRLAAAENDLAGADAAYQAARGIEADVRGEFLFEKLGASVDWGNLKATVDGMERALRRHPRSVPLLVHRAELLRDPQLCRYDEAVDGYRRAALLAPGQGWVLAHLARALHQRSGGTEGRGEFDRAAALSPRCGWIRAWRGAYWSRVGEARRAFADFDAAEALMPWYPFTYAWRGALRRKNGDAAAAVADLDVALRLDPGYAFSWNERFQARLEAGDPVGAADDLKTAFALNPKYAWAEIRGAKARRELDAAVRAHPAAPWLRVWRGRARLTTDPAGAAADLRAAVRRLPREAIANSSLGLALAASGRQAEALRRLAAAARLEPRSWSARKALADAHSSAGEWRKALPHLRAAAALAPTTVSVLVEHAAAAARLGRSTEALASLAKAIGLDPGAGAARALAAKVHLARAARRQARGDYAGQRADFRAALDAAPDLFPPAERRRIEAILAR
jgi:tetratricopeptide (TPR) repeat protein